MYTTSLSLRELCEIKIQSGGAAGERLIPAEPLRRLYESTARRRLVAS